MMEALFLVLGAVAVLATAAFLVVVSLTFEDVIGAVRPAEEIGG